MGVIVCYVQYTIRWGEILVDLVRSIPYITARQGDFCIVPPVIYTEEPLKGSAGRRDRIPIFLNISDYNIAIRLQQLTYQLWISYSPKLSVWLKYIRLKIRDFYSFCVCFSLSNFSPFWRVFRTLQWKFWVELPFASLLMLTMFLASLLLLVSLLLRVSFLLLTFVMFILLLSTQCGRRSSCVLLLLLLAPLLNVASFPTVWFWRSSCYCSWCADCPYCWGHLSC